MTTAPARHVVDTGYLFQHLDRLTKESREVVRRFLTGHADQQITIVQVPSLWQQMEDCVAADNAGGGIGRAAPGSRSPVDLAMVSLMADISREVVRALLASAVTPHWRPVHSSLAQTPTTGPTQPVLVQQRLGPGLTSVDPELAGQLVDRMHRRVTDVAARAGSRELDTEANLRALAEHLGDGHTPQDVVTEWEHRYRRWVAQAETALALDVAENTTVRKPVKGLPCTHCLATAVIRYDEEGGTHWDPPMVAVIRDEELLATVCQRCGGHR